MCVPSTVWDILRIHCLFEIQAGLGILYFKLLTWQHQPKVNEHSLFSIDIILPCINEKHRWKELYNCLFSFITYEIPTVSWFINDTKTGERNGLYAGVKDYNEHLKIHTSENLDVTSIPVIEII